jgi:hypothetical protein
VPSPEHIFYDAGRRIWRDRRGVGKPANTHPRRWAHARCAVRHLNETAGQDQRAIAAARVAALRKHRAEQTANGPCSEGGFRAKRIDACGAASGDDGTTPRGDRVMDGDSRRPGRRGRKGRGGTVAPQYPPTLTRATRWARPLCCARTMPLVIDETLATGRRSAQRRARLAPTRASKSATTADAAYRRVDPRGRPAPRCRGDARELRGGSGPTEAPTGR